jgi:hypothetical protein
MLVAANAAFRSSLASPEIETRRLSASTGSSRRMQMSFADPNNQDASRLRVRRALPDAFAKTKGGKITGTAAATDGEPDVSVDLHRLYTQLAVHRRPADANRIVTRALEEREIEPAAGQDRDDGDSCRTCCHGLISTRSRWSQTISGS